jgi:hypothetical protein
MILKCATAKRSHGCINCNRRYEILVRTRNPVKSFRRLVEFGAYNMPSINLFSDLRFCQKLFRSVVHLHFKMKTRLLFQSSHQDGMLFMATFE